MDEKDKKIMVGAGVVVAGIAGLGLYSLLKSRKPQQPEGITLSNLLITPTTVAPGETVTISVLVNNHSASIVSTVITLGGDVTGSQAVDIDASSSKTVSFIATPTAEGTYHVTVDGLSGTFICTSEPHGDIVFSDLVISPPTCIQGEIVTISVTATNNGNAHEVIGVTLSIAGDKYDDTTQLTKQIGLEAGASKVVTFTFQPTVAETYTVTIENLSATLVVNPGPSWPGWTEGTVVYDITVTPDVLYLGQTVQIGVYIQGPWPATYPMNLEARVYVDGTTLSKVFTIEFRNPTLLFTFTPAKIGDYMVTAQDKTATFTVLENPLGTYYSPFGGTRMPLCTDIVLPDVQPFTYPYVYPPFSWPGGDLKYSDLVAATDIGGWPTRSPVSRFTFWFTPTQITERLPYAQPIAWNPDDAQADEFVLEITKDPTFHVPVITLMAVGYSCKAYWSSKDELAKMIVGYCGSRSITLPTDWATQYGKNIDLCRGIHDWVYYPGIKSQCQNSPPGCNYYIMCPFCGRFDSGFISADRTFDKLSFARRFLEHMEAAHPNHPLTEPAWF
jgi:hypothetical protein